MMKSILISALTCILFSCSSTKPLPDQDWAEKKWTLVNMNGNPVQVSHTDKDAHLVFHTDTKTISGSGGCNRLTGAYLLSKSSLKFPSTASTRMACIDMAFEQAFLDWLKKVDAYEYSGTELTLKEGKKSILVFRQTGKP